MSTAGYNRPCDLLLKTFFVIFCQNLIEYMLYRHYTFSISAVIKLVVLTLRKDYVISTYFYFWASYNNISDFKTNKVSALQ